MATAPKKKSWVICPTCKQPNPVGAQFCQHCHKAIRHDSSPISYEEMEEVSKEKLSRWKRRRRSKVVVIRLALAAILTLAVFVGLYFLTDIVSPPPQNVNSDSLPGDWAMFRHNLNRSGTSDPDGSPAQGTVAWVFSTGGPIYSSPAVSNGIVYIGSRDSKLYALDADTGAMLWEKEIRPWWITLNLYGLAPRVPSQTGLLWRLWLGAPVDSSPALIDNIMYIGVGNKLLAIDIEDQQMLWAFQTEGSVRSSPVVVGKTVYIGSEEGQLYAVDAVSGQRLWGVSTDDRITSSPAVAAGMIYVGSHDGNLYAIK